MTRFFLFLLPLSFLIPFSSLGQVEEAKKKQSREAVPEVVLGKNRIIYQNRIYRLNAPYVTFAYGAGHGFESDKIEQNMTLAFHYFIKGFGLRLGYHSSSDTKIWWRSYQKLNDLFLGFGTRLEKPRWNFAIFGGPSFAYGSYIDWNPDRQKDWAYGFATPGIHAEIQTTYRIIYDIGVGLSLYGTYNRYYPVAGAQLHLFFSTAYIRNYD